MGQNPYPAILHAAEAAAVSEQRWFLWLSGCRLCALVSVAVLVAIAGLIGQWAVFIALGPISVALFAEIVLLARRHEKRWYRARAVAESAKTIVWRYQACGLPMGREVPDGEADSELTRRLQNLIDEFRDLALPASSPDQITPRMRRYRSLPLEERKSAYRLGRIEDQLSWYSSKADWNRRMGNWSQLGLIAFEVVALVAALVAALQEFSLGIYSLASALAVAGVGWVQIKRYGSLAESYALTSQQLAAINSTIHLATDENAWLETVNQVEDAISKEHTLWLGYHGRTTQ